MNDHLEKLSHRYLWWLPLDKATENKERLIAQVMALGVWEDAMWLLNQTGEKKFISVLKKPPVGTFSPKAWVFWHIWLGLGLPSSMPPARIIPDE